MLYWMFAYARAARFRFSSATRRRRLLRAAAVGSIARLLNRSQVQQQNVKLPTWNVLTNIVCASLDQQWLEKQQGGQELFAG